MTDTPTLRMTDEQQRIIRERFATTRTEELVRLTGLGYFKILRAAHRMGLRKEQGFGEAMSAIAVSKKPHYRCKGDTKFKSGSIEAEERDRWMREHWATTPDDDCARHFGVNPRTIRRWARSLGLRKDAETTWTRRVLRLIPTPEEMNYYGAYIAEHYPTEPAKEIAKALGIGLTTVYNYAKRLGIKKSENMKQKHHGGSPVRPVAQLDPETLEVIKVWESIGEAKKAVGSTNIETAIKKLRKAKGYYWCDLESIETFTLNLRQEPKREKRQPSSASDILAKNEEFKEDMKKLMPDAVPASVAAPAVTPKFKIGDHVWAKQPKELCGRIGYVISVDTYRMMYDVKCGTEIWNVLESDLELVNDPVMSEYITERSTAALADYTDEELWHELERRGWEGNLTRKQTISLGGK